MILSGEEIKKYIEKGKKDPNKGLIIEPLFEEEQIKLSSIDLRLGTDVIIFNTIKRSSISLFSDTDFGKKDISEIFNELKKKVRDDIRKYVRYEELDIGEELVLHPGQFVLGSTLEYVTIPTKLAGRLEGRSSIGRLGIQIHVTAGFVDPGFYGNLTFELSNLGDVPVSLYCGMRVAQLSLFQVKGGGGESYSEREDSKYAFDTASTMSKIYEDSDLETLLKIRESKIGS